MEGRSRVTTIVVTGILSVIALSTLSGRRASSLGPGIFGVAACSVVVLALYRSFGGSVREDPAKAIARATLVLLALVAVLGAATGIGLIAAIGGGVAVAMHRDRRGVRPGRRPACWAGRDGSSSRWSC